MLKTADKTVALNPSETATDVIPLPMESGTDAPPPGVLLKHTKLGKGGTLKRDPSFLERQAAERARASRILSFWCARHGHEKIGEHLVRLAVSSTTTSTAVPFS